MFRHWTGHILHFYQGQYTQQGEAAEMYKPTSFARVSNVSLLNGYYALHTVDITAVRTNGFDSVHFVFPSPVTSKFTTETGLAVQDEFQCTFLPAGNNAT